jgi:ABC-2 type transport system permease protein
VIHAVASQQILALRRQRVFIGLLIMFMVMTAMAGLLGWSSHQTIVRVYKEAVSLLASRGQGAPPNPFLLKPELSQLSNMVIYVPLLGALLALLVGHLSIADDATTGLGRLIFSRPVSRTGYVWGKVIAGAALMGGVLIVGFLVSTTSLLLIDRGIPSASNLGRLVLFYGLSWLYLMIFLLIGMVAMLVTRRRSLALLVAMGAWLVVTFVIPQFTSGLRPVASLNPIVDPVSASQRFFQITASARPLSIVEQYKMASGQILATAGQVSMWTTLSHVFPLIVFLVILLSSAYVLVRRYDFSQVTSGE